MNRIHDALISYIRKTLEGEVENQNKKTIDGKTNEQIARMMFSNFRGRDKQSRGLRLTNFGLQLMKNFFKSYTTTSPDERNPGPAEIIYLDRKAKLPYYITEGGDITMFDPELGIKLKLADGDLRVLIEMDGSPLTFR